MTSASCTLCDGKGRISQLIASAPEGRGVVSFRSCPECDGKGVVDAPREKELMTAREALSALRSFVDLTRMTPFLKEALSTLEALVTAEDEFREALYARDAEIATLSTELARRDKESGYDLGFKDGFQRGIDESQGFPDFRINPEDPLPGPVLDYPSAPYDDTLILTNPTDSDTEPRVSYTVYHNGQQVGAIRFQRGPVGAAGSVRGVFDTHLLAIVYDRMERFFRADKSRSTEKALFFVRCALDQLIDRRDRRFAAGILGTDAGEL